MQNILKQIAKHFQINLADIKVEPIHHGNKEKQNVARLIIRKKRYLIKLYEITVPVTESGWTPFQIEKFTLSTLYKGGCLVPNVIWSSKKYNALLLSWCGDWTLDALAQSSRESEFPPTLLQTILRVSYRVEEVFMKHEEQFEPYVFHFELRQNLKNALEQGRKTIDYLENLSKISLTSTQEVELDKAWDVLSARLMEANPILGSLDYQARNIVIDDELPYFIDFASVGWDWQERRVIQYFNSIGANQEDANFVSLLNRELVDEYAEWVVNHRDLCYRQTRSEKPDIAARIDGHHLLFYLSVIHKLLKAVAMPDIAENQILLEAWGDARLRFQRAISIIIHSNLSDDVWTNYIRDMIGKFQNSI